MTANEANGVVERTIALAEYQPHPRNYNGHPDAQIEAIKLSLTEFGQVRNIVAWRNFFVAGHGVAKAAAALGMQTLRANVIPDDWSEERVLAYLAADNELGRLADPDEAALAAILQETRSYDEALFAATGYDNESFDDLLKRLVNADEPTPLETPADLDDDDLAKLRAEWGVEPGQMWTLGEHRLVCGDCTDAAVVQRLMAGERAVLFATDPPYLVDYDGTNHPHKWGEPDKNKDWSETYHDWDSSAQGEELYDGFIAVAVAHAIQPNAAWYCWHASRRQAMLEQIWERHGAFVHQQIVWVKDRPVLTRSYYMWRHEPCFYGWIKGKEPARRSTDYPHTVWEIPTIPAGQKTLHPTSKPLEVFAIPMRQHTLPGELCYEPFSGSGSQILAAEELGRRVRAVEVSPEYVAVALQRWSDLVGRTPEVGG